MLQDQLSMLSMLLRFTRSLGIRSRQCRFYSDSHSHSALPRPRLDYRSIGERTDHHKRNARRRKAPISDDDVQTVAHLYTEHKEISSLLNAKLNARSVLGERIRKLADENNLQSKSALLADAKGLKEQVLNLQTRLHELDDRLLAVALAIPNDTHPSTPVGSESSAATILRYGSNPLPHSPHRDHVEVGRALDLIDLEAGATVTGSSWYFLKNEAALLEIALTNYAISIAIKHGFTPVTTPDVVRSDIASRCGFQPRDHSEPPVSQMYHLTTNHTSETATPSPSSPELVLSGTAEIPLAGMFANKILPHQSLPIKVAGLGRAFRAEAGARGADTRGLYRVHQFSKLELFAVTIEKDSESMMKQMMEIQLEICRGLGFPFRVLDMPTEELGASAYRKYDIEAWMPGRGNWGEISSLSNCTDYQSRRLHIRHRSAAAENPINSPTIPFAHTLNGTAAAIPRLIVAIVENGVRFDDQGRAVGLNLPETLKAHWFGLNGRADVVRWVPVS